MALENQEMILQTFNILHKSSLCANLFTNKLTLSCKPDRKRQTVKFSERQVSYCSSSFLLFWGEAGGWEALKSLFQSRDFVLELRES